MTIKSHWWLLKNLQDLLFPLLWNSYLSVIRTWELSDRSRIWSPCGPQIHWILQEVHLRGWPIHSRCWEQGELKNIRAVRQDPVCTQQGPFTTSGSKRVVKILKQRFQLLSKIHIILSYNDSRCFWYPCKCSIHSDSCWNNSNLKWNIKYLCLVQREYCKKIGRN